MEKVELNNHYRQISKVLLWILVLNWTVALAKIIYGVMSSCSSMAADGFHSLSDGASNIIGLIGIHFACQPKDKDHPYGHKKYETFFSLGIAMLLFLLSFNLIHGGVERFRNPVTPSVDKISFLIMIATLIVNFLVMRYEKACGLKLKSDILVSDAKHTSADILTSISVIITLFFIKAGYHIIDPIATILIALFIARAGFAIVKESSYILCDTVAIIDESKITDIVLKTKGVKSCHKIRSRGRPDDIHIDLHVEVNPSMHMEEAHKISYEIEGALKKRIPEITDVVVHMEPRET
jgi:cation diffusion facilitator family transporter